VFNIFKNKLHHQQFYVLDNQHTNNDGFKSTLDKHLSSEIDGMMKITGNNFAAF